MSGRVPEFDYEHHGKTYKAELAVVNRFTLQVEDHGIFTALIDFKSGGCVQGIPARGLDSYDKNTKTRHGTAFGCDLIMAFVGAVGSPEHAKGKRVVVFRERYFIDGFAPVGDDGEIGKPVFPQEIADKHYPREVAS